MIQRVIDRYRSSLFNFKRPLNNAEKKENLLNDKVDTEEDIRNIVMSGPFVGCFTSDPYRTFGLRARGSPKLRN